MLPVSSLRIDIPILIIEAAFIYGKIKWREKPKRIQMDYLSRTCTAHHSAGSSTHNICSSSLPPHLSALLFFQMFMLQQGRDNFARFWSSRQSVMGWPDNIMVQTERIYTTLTQIDIYGNKSNPTFSSPAFPEFHFIFFFLLPFLFLLFVLIGFSFFFFCHCCRSTDQLTTYFLPISSDQWETWLSYRHVFISVFSNSKMCS